jgi:hypothetical protein
MNENERQIIELLNSGRSYSDIQQILRVSSKTIASIKKKAHFPSTESGEKACFPSTESNWNSFFLDTFQSNPNPPFEKLETKNNSISKTKLNNYMLTNKKQNFMNSDNDFYEDESDEQVSKLDVEKYRLKLSHKLEMEKLQMERDHRESELKLKRDEFDYAKQKTQEAMRSLLYRAMKIIGNCIDGDYEYEDAENLLEDAKKTLNDCDQFCFVHKIGYFKGSDVGLLLNKAIKILGEFLDDFDQEEDGPEPLEFEESFRRLEKNTSYHSFL